MSTAGELVTRARDVHPAFTKEHTPDATALRMLQRSRASLHALALRYHRAAFTTTLTLPFDPAMLGPGIDLGADADVIVAIRVRHAPSGDVVAIPRREATPELVTDTGPRCALVTGPALRTLRLVPATPREWDGIVEVAVDRVLALPPLTTLQSPTSLPDTADEPLVAHLAAKMGLRGLPSGTTLPPIPGARLDDEAAAAMRLYLESLAGQRRTAAFRVAEGL